VLLREVRIGDATVVEGNSGTRTVTLTLTLSQAQSTPLAVSWRTLNGSATAGSDFGAASGTVTFAANSTTATITLTVSGDTAYEGNEEFMVQLLTGADFNLADGFGLVSITEDDAAPPAGASSVAPSVPAEPAVVAAPGAATTASPDQPRSRKRDSS
jgi:chitinase